MGRRTSILRITATLVAAGCGPSSPTSASGGAGSQTNTTEATSMTTEVAGTVSSGNVDFECPEENVFEGDLTLLTGDDPMALYGLTEITGRLTISSDDIVDLSFLSCLRAVAELVVRENSGLQTFHGLERLTDVVVVTVADNPALQSLSGLDALTEIHTLRVRRNASIQTLGLDSLERASSIQIGTCTGFAAEGGPGLTDVVGLSGLRGEVKDVFIEGNEDLASLDGMHEWAANGVTISRYLFVRHNRQLPTQYAEEILDLFGGGLICGNQGDDGPWDTLDPICNCYAGPPDG